jgi:hypothetical protein
VYAFSTAWRALFMTSIVSQLVHATVCWDLKNGMAIEKYLCCAKCLLVKSMGAEPIL